MRGAIRTLILATEYLEYELQTKVSQGYTRSVKGEIVECGLLSPGVRIDILHGRGRGILKSQFALCEPPVSRRSASRSPINLPQQTAVTKAHAIAMPR
jgi:hypothetical protein